jgi:hypothetical protein
MVPQNLSGHIDCPNNDQPHLGLAKGSPVESRVPKKTPVSAQLPEMPREARLPFASEQ